MPWCWKHNRKKLLYVYLKSRQIPPPQWSMNRWGMNAAIFLFILVFFLLFTKLSLNFSHIRGIIMSTKGGFPSWNHIAHILVSYLLITRKTPGFSALTHRAKNLYNVASFYIRNAYSASIKSNEDRFPHEIQVLEELNGVVDELNVIRQKHHSTPFHIIDHDHRFVSMQHLDGFLNCVTRSITVLFLLRQIRMFCICCIVTGKAFLLL